jgi:hypothetical protein
MTGVGIIGRGSQLRARVVVTDLVADAHAVKAPACGRQPDSNQRIV